MRREKQLIARMSLRIKELRTGRGISQEDFFLRTGIHVGRIERGKFDITITTLYRVCDFFEISFEDFFKEM